MNRPLEALKFALLNLLALGVAILFWPYALAALFALAISGMKLNRWVSSVVAFALVVAWRVVSGEWIITIGDTNPGRWYFEVLPGIVSWAFAASFVSAFAQWPAEFLEGYRSAISIERQPTPK
jgi:general stress protein CsbA